MKEDKKCIVCKSKSEEMPLLEFEFKGQKIHVCSQHIPIIIHQPHQLKNLLPEMPIRPADHED
jgi:hypothetical protein